MNVTFVNPIPLDRYGSNTIPLNLGYLASYLKSQVNDVDISILDMSVKHDVKKRLLEIQPDIVGITSTTGTINIAYDIADFVKSSLKSLVVMGGVHVTIMPEEALKHADIAVVGEGEKAIVDIIKNDIKCGIVSNHFIENIDDVPMIDWSLFEMEKYISSKNRMVNNWHFTSKKSMAIMTSRGCPYKCTFCHNSWRDMPVRYNSAERVIYEIEHLIDNYGIGGIVFIDDEFLTNKPRLKKICEYIVNKKLDIEWGCQARANTLDMKTLKMIKKAGCKMILIGFESGSQRMLDFIDKKTRVKDNRRAIKLCYDAGMKVIGNFIFGIPSETKEDLEETMNFIRENMDYMTYPVTTVMTIFPGTKLWEWCVDNNYMTNDYSTMEFRYDISSYMNKNMEKSYFLSKYMQISLEVSIHNASNVEKLRQVVLHPIKVTRYVFNMLRGIK